MQFIDGDISNAFGLSPFISRAADQRNVANETFENEV